MKVATTTGTSGHKGHNYNKLIMVLFVFIILLFGLLAGLYVVNQRVTVQNRAAEPQLNVQESPYIECQWKAEQGVEYTYRISYKKVGSDEVTVLPEGIVSLGDNQTGVDGVETSSSGDTVSVIYRNVVKDTQYSCEVYVGGPKCGEASYIFSSSESASAPAEAGTITPTATPEEGPGAIVGTITVTPTGTLIPDQGGTPIISQSSRSSSSSGSLDSQSESSASGSSSLGTSPSPTMSPSPSPTKALSVTQSSSGSTISPTITSSITSTRLSSTPTSSVSQQSSASGSASLTKTPTPPVSGVVSASLIFLLVGIVVVGLGLIL